jgi:ribosomal protein L31
MVKKRTVSQLRLQDKVNAPVHSHCHPAPIGRQRNMLDVGQLSANVVMQAFVLRPVS